MGERVGRHVKKHENMRVWGKAIYLQVESGVKHGRVKMWKVGLPEKVPNEEFQNLYSIFMALPTSVKRKTRKSSSLSPEYKCMKDVEDEESTVTIEAKSVKSIYKSLLSSKGLKEIVNPYLPKGSPFDE